MPSFKEIRETQDLPPPLTTRETLAFDMKAQHSPGAFELAKDVAMFANANGGVILVGAAEDKPNARLGTYLPITEPEARRVCEDYEKAVEARCSPRPLVDTAIIPKDGGFVVAVNVWPYPAQPVAVWVQGDAKDGYGDRAYVYPARLGTRCEFLKPEVVAMLMLPEVRRITILLEKIPHGDPITVMGSDHQREQARMLEVRPLDNVVVLRCHLNGNESFIPLDAVTSVWRQGTETWRIVVDGRVRTTGNGIVYDPTRIR